jgi:outer membrane protein assembly factor BamB
MSERPLSIRWWPLGLIGLVGGGLLYAVQGEGLSFIRVYTFGATGILNCLDGADGRVAWSRPIAKESAPILFGYVSSPLVYGQDVLVTAGGQAGSIVVVDRDTGEIAWTKGSSKAVYSSPQLLVTGREAQILVFDATGLGGHDAVTGDTRWRFPWRKF